MAQVPLGFARAFLAGDLVMFLDVVKCEGQSVGQRRVAVGAHLYSYGDSEG